MPGDRVLVLKVPYYFHEPRRGDIIVFEDPDPGNQPDRGIIGGFFHWMFEGLGVQRPDSEDCIKRVIGTPGDVVQRMSDEVNRIIRSEETRTKLEAMGTFAEGTTLGPLASAAQQPIVMRVTYHASSRP